MSTTSLTAKYRPQRFADVAGQDAVKRILSRAAAEDKIAPAYLFSGTRGVGKTTLARVLAKALNCQTAPTAEPCNVCAQCRQITAGVSPDVIEIDAATHGKVEDARRLKEDVGYAPLQSRYKVFIIDEAHMLSTAAFNALLKTLEEPPARVTFILATTEAHKFPATIISRCQHYLFKRLTQAELEAHLTGLLSREAVAFEQTAVKLIARRGAGSVRDSMSLLAQVLALGGAELTEADARNVLGLAGQEVFFGLIEAIHAQDGPAVVEVLRQVLDKGLDIGFFLRELAAMWRNLFLLRQAGEKGLAVVDLPAEETGLWLEWAGRFDAAHIHACWQMTLEGQRRVLTSLEPALSLELMLLNLAYLPRLLPLQNLASCAMPPSGGGGPAPSGPGAPSGPARTHGPSGSSRTYGPSGAAGGYGPSGPSSGAYGPSGAAGASGGYGPSSPAGASGDYGPSGLSEAAEPQGPYGGPRDPAGLPPRPTAPAPGPAPAQAGAPRPAWQAPSAAASAPAPAPAASGASQAGPQAAAGQPGPVSAPRASFGPPTFEGFKRFAVKNGEVIGLKQAKGVYEPEAEPPLLRLLCTNAFHVNQLRHPDKLRVLSGLAADYFGRPVDIAVEAGENGHADRLSPDDLKRYIDERPEVRQALSAFDAEIIERKPR
ncbi:MAG: DNA polymerase III subunit gamma/tau [Solidesulfovibrio sp. DCME]|uniref:DNA polymerase III subunit gamma/tau n=1 Tax=Solidesulfovibrio sp. DCME TaxID=3447380 RepID=UPI003D13C0F2